MKRHILITCLILLSVKTFSQQNIVTLSGGYSFANIEDTEVKATGWRINGLYELNPMEGKIAHGFSIGYISLTATESSVTSTINSVPIYYAPKVMFGEKKIKGFIKGAIGTQFASIKREGLVNLSDNDFGFYGGGGVGIIISINENVFINGEYEIAWASNSYYRDGWISTAGGGIGFKF
jgi:hypothetical protein